MAKLRSASEVIIIAFLNKNIDTDLMKDAHIEVSQEEHIRPILTQDLYDEIVSQSADDNLTVANATLLDDFIKPALAFFVALDVVPHFSIRMSEKGLMINSSESSEAATRQERMDIMSRFREQGQTMLEKMVRFIEDEDNIDDYPLFENGSSEIINTTLKGGIIL